MFVKWIFDLTYMYKMDMAVQEKKYLNNEICFSNLKLIMLPLAILAVFSVSLVDLVSQWWDSPEYGHGLFMPFISCYIVWRQRDKIAQLGLKSSVWGYLLLLGSLCLLLAATLADIESVKHYSFCAALIGLALLYGGWQLLKICALPILLIILVIPLPYLFISNLTAGLQLISSELGTWLIRLFGIPVFLEGNIIDMGVYKLQVVEACSGLRYLYPLLSISLLVTHFLRTPLWFKAILVLSTVPITIFMNSLRIAITGLLVNNYGNEVAEGFLHDFEGWVVFLAAFVCLMAEVWVFSKLTQKGKSVYGLFNFDAPQSPERPIITNLGSSSYIASLVTVALLGGSSVVFAFSNSVVIPERKLFSEFPMRVDGRNVSLYSFEQDVIDILKPDDYFVGNYLSRQDQPVGLYMVYYSQQKDGSALHSPKVCIPGGGWIVEDSSVISFSVQDSTLAVNRVLIRKGDRKQLVYYWINQMGVNYTNEYIARISLIKSAIADNRSDGALIRVNMVVDGDDLDAADDILQSFVQAATLHLPEYLPSKGV